MKDIKNKNIKWWLGVASCVALFSIIGVFAYCKMSFVLNGVQIQANIEHEDNTPLATINGKAQNATYISLNGREIFIDKDGSFSEKIALIPGFSVITIDAMDKFGKEKEKTFQLVYKEGSPLVAMLIN
ncbi:MAG: hypothetical protein WCV79_04285 [Candidatus Paceibacterota bacterium]